MFDRILNTPFRGGSKTAATSKMELIVIVVNGWKPLTIITRSSILDVAAVLDPPLPLIFIFDLLHNSKIDKINSYFWKCCVCIS